MSANERSCARMCTAALIVQATTEYRVTRGRRRVARAVGSGAPPEAAGE
jgi:hypothetical protein